MLDIDLSQYHSQLQLSKKEGVTYVFDPVRRQHYRALPEELVRQSWIIYLTQNHSVRHSSLGVEKKIQWGEQSKRYDLVYYNKGQAQILFEFKSFKEKITESAARQIANYNLHLKVPHLILSNGVDSFGFNVDFDKSEVEEITQFPRI